MTLFARIVAVVAALFMAVVLVWDGARFILMGADVRMYEAGDRPAALVGRDWPAEEMKRWAQTHDVDVIALGNPKRPGVAVGYPAHPGSEYDQWVKHGYPCLNNCRLRPTSLAEHPGAIKGFEIGVGELYFMGSDAHAAAEEARAYFDRLGWKTGVEEINTLESWQTTFLRLFPQVTVVIVVLVLMLCAGHVLARSKAVGVQLLQGNPRWQILVSDVVSWTAWYVAAAISLLGLGYLGALVLVDGHFFTYFARAYALFVGVFWLAGTIGLSVAHQILRATPILESIKGRTRFGLSFPVVYALRSLVVVMCATLLVLLNQTSLELRRAEDIAAGAGPLQDASSYTTLQGLSDDPVRERAAADEVRRLYAAGKIVVSIPTEQYYTTAESGTDVTVGNGGDRIVLQVNPEYLSMYPVAAPDGRRVDPTGLDPTALTVMYPPGTPSAVRDDVRRWTSSIPDPTSWGTVSGRNGARPVIKELPVAAGGRHISATLQGITRVHDPILVVYPTRFAPSDNFALQSGNLFVRNTDIPLIKKQAPHLARSVTFESVASNIANAAEEKQGRLSRQLFELAAYLLLLPLATIGVVLMYTRQHRRRIFVQSISGRPISEMVPLVLVLELVSLAVIAWVSRPRPPTLDQLHVFGSETSSIPLYSFLAAVGVASLLCVAEYALFRRAERAIISQRGTEA